MSFSTVIKLLWSFEFNTVNSSGHQQQQQRHRIKTHANIFESWIFCWFVTFSRVSHTRLGEVWIWNLGNGKNNTSPSLCKAFHVHSTNMLSLIYTYYVWKWIESRAQRTKAKSTKNDASPAKIYVAGKIRGIFASDDVITQNTGISTPNNSLIYWLHIDPGEIDDRREIFLAWFSLNFSPVFGACRGFVAFLCPPSYISIAQFSNII